ncbi:cation:proton antiporter [Microvirga thermotolerans]|uniref:Sodium:proton antiporter n=1 Tax=Microvirga thermotolerans TaxID=2651334 RepID=A0A5P9JQ58_9HYPH|nr:cation:proton antiporter [Microvirga thermotolerans]QFU14902.1 sodium:proton antiporter [Microvirga thermotolerans]
MDPYIVVLTGFGAVVLLTAWLPMVLKDLPLTLPIACVALGAAIFAVPDVPGVIPHPGERIALVERLSELVVIIALLGAGLKIDRPFGWFRWRIAWRLLGIAMPLTIAALALLGHGLLGLGAATALLLAAALAPTDPVLASDVQVGPPGSGEEDEVRFSLTSEAGLNDGLAFPFVLLAVFLTRDAGAGTFAEWLVYAVGWKIAVGAGVGYLAGRGLGWLTFHLPNRARLSRTGVGFVALGITCLVYGLCEMARGYGFLGVFVAALALRATQAGHPYHKRLHDFAEELERLLMMMVLVLFGGTITGAGLLAALTWPAVVFAVLAIFLVRPLAGWICLLGVPRPADEKLAIGFFGIRGIGSIYYLAYALQRGRFEAPDLLWSTAGLIVLVSILLHGVTVTPAMSRLDRRRRARVPEAPIPPRGEALPSADPPSPGPGSAPGP